MQEEGAAIFRSRVTIIAGASLVLMVGQGCGWRKAMSFPSPSRQSMVEIWQTRVANQLGTRVQLVSEGNPTVLYETPGKALIYFIHVVWSPDERRVAIVGSGDIRFELAYDLPRRVSIPFDALRQQVADSIAMTYHVPEEQDPIQWAASNRAHLAFLKLHPEFRPKYLGP